MRFVVLGGMGLTGRCAVMDLLENPKVDKIIVGDMAPSYEFNDQRVEFRKIDVRDVDATAKLLSKSDVVINAVQYYYNLEVMKAAAIAKVNYVDLGGLYHMTNKQLDLDDEFKNAGVLALIGMGAQPGISSVAASFAVNKMESVDSIFIRDAWVDKTENYSKLFFTWSPSTFFDELILPAIHFDNGRFIESDPLSYSEKYDFDNEIGEMEIYRTLHSEIATMPDSFSNKGISHVEWLEGSKDILKMKLIADIGFGRTDEFELDGYKFKPREFLFRFLKKQGLFEAQEDVQIKDHEKTVVEVIGKNEGKDKRVIEEIIFKYDDKWGVSAAQKEVGVPASIVAQMIASGTIKAKGVKPPEQIVPPRQLFRELQKRDIKIVNKEEAVI